MAQLRDSTKPTSGKELKKAKDDVLKRRAATKDPARPLSAVLHRNVAKKMDKFEPIPPPRPVETPHPTGCSARAHLVKEKKPEPKRKAGHLPAWYSKRKSEVEKQASEQKTPEETVPSNRHSVTESEQKTDAPVRQITTEQVDEFLERQQEVARDIRRKRLEKIEQERHSVKDKIQREKEKRARAYKRSVRMAEKMKRERERLEEYVAPKSSTSLAPEPRSPGNDHLLPKIVRRNSFDADSISRSPLIARKTRPVDDIELVLSPRRKEQEAPGFMKPKRRKKKSRMARMAAAYGLSLKNKKPARKSFKTKTVTLEFGADLPDSRGSRSGSRGSSGSSGLFPPISSGSSRSSPQSRGSKRY